MIEINNYKYTIDSFGSLHQIISLSEYFNKLNFYSKNIYLNGRFFNHDTNLDNLMIHNSIQKDIEDIEHKLKILNNWELREEITKILDLGCGYGLFLHEWVKRYNGIGYGYEISNMAQKISGYLTNNIDIRLLNVNNIEKKHIDTDTEMIVAFDFIEHLLDLPSFLNNLVKIYKGFKYFLVELPIIPKLRNYQELINYKYFYPEHHIHLFTTAGVINEFNNVGLKLLSIEPLKSNLKNLLLFKNARNS